MYITTANLSMRTIEDENFILNRADSVLHALNPTAALMWDAIQNQNTPHEIAQKIVDTFEVSFEEALSDTRTFLSECEKKGLISFTETPL